MESGGETACFKMMMMMMVDDDVWVASISGRVLTKGFGGKSIGWMDG